MTLWEMKGGREVLTVKRKKGFGFSPLLLFLSCDLGPLANLPEPQLSQQGELLHPLCCRRCESSRPFTEHLLHAWCLLSAGLFFF